MKKNIIRVILLILLVGTFFIIFGFSSQDGEESSGISRKITEIITDKILRLSDDNKIQIVDRMESVIRKIAHFSIYTIVGVLLMGFVSTYKIDEMKRIYISIVIGIIYATSDEIHQSFIPGRSSQLTDVMIDTMGVALGICLILILLEIVSKRKHKKCHI